MTDRLLKTLEPTDGSQIEPSIDQTMKCSGWFVDYKKIHITVHCRSHDIGQSVAMSYNNAKKLSDYAEKHATSLSWSANDHDSIELC